VFNISLLAMNAFLHFIINNKIMHRFWDSVPLHITPLTYSATPFGISLQVSHVPQPVLRNGIIFYAAAAPDTNFDAAPAPTQLYTQ
jgi:hypothetical protein